MKRDRRELAFRLLTIPKAIRQTKTWGGGWDRSPTYCSICRERMGRAIIITKSDQEQWWGFCLWCVQQMAEAVEDG